MVVPVSQSSAHLQTRLVADFSRWLKRNKVAVHEMTLEHTKRYLRCRARHLRPRRDDTAALIRLLNLLRQQGVNTTQEVQAEATEVEQFSRRVRSVFATGTRSCNRDGRQLFGLCPAILNGTFRCWTGSTWRPVRSRRDLVCSASGCILHLKRAKLMTTSLRSFLRFVRYRGDIAVDLAAAVPAVANWSMATIPRSISPDHAKQVLAHCNRQTAAGKRDYAILLLLARLGLRAGEIAALTLDDIDWKQVIYRCMARVVMSANCRCRLMWARR